MKSLFRPIDFGQPEAPADNEQVNFSANKVIIAGLIKEVRDEIGRLQSGTSEHRRGAIHFDKGSCPAMAALQRFEDDPTPGALDVFLVVAKSDFGHVVGDVFRKWSKNAFEVGEAKPSTPRKKTFNQAVKDGLLDLFRSGMTTTVTVQQHEKMEMHAFQVSGAITDHCIGMLRKLQDAALESVRHLDAENKALKERVDALENKIADTKEKVAISIESSDNYIGGEADGQTITEEEDVSNRGTGDRVVQTRDDFDETS